MQDICGREDILLLKPAASLMSVSPPILQGHIIKTLVSTVAKCNVVILMYILYPCVHFVVVTKARMKELAIPEPDASSGREEKERTLQVLQCFNAVMAVAYKSFDQTFYVEFGRRTQPCVFRAQFSLQCLLEEKLL